MHAFYLPALDSSFGKWYRMLRKYILCYVKHSFKITEGPVSAVQSLRLVACVAFCNVLSSILAFCSDRSPQCHPVWEEKNFLTIFACTWDSVSVLLQFSWKVWTECLLYVSLFHIYIWVVKLTRLCNLGELPAKPCSAIATNGLWTVPASPGIPCKNNEHFLHAWTTDRASNSFCACWHAVPVRSPEAYAMGLQWSPFLVKSVAPRPCLDASTASFVWCLLSYTLKTGSFFINYLRFRKSLLWLPVRAHYAFLFTEDLRVAV